MKKPLIIFLSIFSLATIALISTSHANMFNRLKKGFYFEKYSTAEEAKAELLRLHPIGSDVGELVKTLEGAGGECVITDGTINKKPIGNGSFEESLNVKNKISRNEDFYSCYYREPLFIISFIKYHWVVSILVNIDKNSQIIGSIRASKHGIK